LEVAVLLVQDVPLGEVITAVDAAVETTAVATNKLSPEAQTILFQVLAVVQVEEAQVSPLEE
jgi:hypothetical protein